MEETKKKRIVIASVLKPVDDARMSEKIAQTISETGLYQVYVIGYPAKARRTSTSVIFHESAAFKRLSLRRLYRPFQILQIILAIKPHLIIITTHELLLAAVLSKLLLRNVRVAYDVQENYFLNILYTAAFPKWLRPLVAMYVRLKEKISSPFIDLFLLAEKTYVHELPFTRDKNCIVENKLRQRSAITTKPKTDENIVLLFSGTLAPTTGILEAIHVAITLHTLDPAVRLKIIGYCAQALFLSEIKNKIKGHDFIELTGGDTLVPHELILQEIQRADFGVIAYTINPATINRMPTKLYEYLGYQLPILLAPNPVWVQYCERYSAHIPVHFECPNALQILQAIKNSSFYTSIPHEVLWDDEAPKLLAAVKTLL